MTADRQDYRDLETLAVFVHGMLAALHLLGIAYNWRRRNRLDICCHALAGFYDLHAAHIHARRVW